MNASHEIALIISGQSSVVVVFAAAHNCSESIHRNDGEKQKNGLNSASALVLRCLILSRVFLNPNLRGNKRDDKTFTNRFIFRYGTITHVPCHHNNSHNAFKPKSLFQVEFSV